MERQFGHSRFDSPVFWLNVRFAHFFDSGYWCMHHFSHSFSLNSLFPKTISHWLPKILHLCSAFAALYLFHVFSSFLVHSIPTTGSSRSASLILFFSFQFQTFHFYALFPKYVILARKSPRSACNLFLPVSIHRMVNLLETSQFNTSVSTISRNYLINIYNEWEKFYGRRKFQSAYVLFWDDKFIHSFLVILSHLIYESWELRTKAMMRFDILPFRLLHAIFFFYSTSSNRSIGMRIFIRFLPFFSFPCLSSLLSRFVSCLIISISSISICLCLSCFLSSILRISHMPSVSLCPRVFCLP